MDLDAFARRVAAVPWGSLHGAYGRSDSTSEHGAGDVAPALLRLARADNVEDDEEANALDVLHSHVWHQGTVFEVSPHALPLVLTLADELRAPARNDLAEAAALIVLGHVDGGPREIETQIAAVTLAHAEMILGWLDDPRAEAASLICRQLPAMHEAWLARIASSRELGVVEWLSLLELAQPPAWVHERALAEIHRDDASATAAALFVARQPPITAELAVRLDVLLRPGAEARLEQAMRLPLAIPPIPSGPFSTAETAVVEAKVVFVGAKMVTLRIPPARNVNLSWIPEGIAKGHTVRIGLSATAHPLSLAWRSEGVEHRVELDASLKPRRA